MSARSRDMDPNAPLTVPLSLFPERSRCRSRCSLASVWGNAPARPLSGRASDRTPNSASGDTHVTPSHAQWFRSSSQPFCLRQYVPSVVRYRSVSTMSSTRRSSSPASSVGSNPSLSSGPSHPQRGTRVPFIRSASRRFSSHDRGLAWSSPSRSLAGLVSSRSTSSRSCASLGNLDAFSLDIGAPAKSRSSSSSSATLRTVSLTRNLAASPVLVSASVSRMASAWHRSCSSCRSAAAASPCVMSISTALASSAHACPVCPKVTGGACLHLCRRNITAAC
mmetsp:Transcript_7615/g.21073  ORF Transcript_7615/g.21073 Transcript_7615/m.21073 type:complete len:279 (+) Transcript_7615:1126-1962(+)